MNSRLYSGTIMHERKVPVTNRFRYRVYFAMIDLDELDTIAEQVSRFSHNAFDWIYVRDRDHGPRDGSPLKPWITELAAQAGIDIEGGRVELLTFPTVLGFRFYPVSFWYCYDASNRLQAILAEVQNTFGEHHNYLLHNEGEPLSWHDKPGATKVFYVSPLMAVDGRYEFRFTQPAERLHVGIYDFIQGPLTMVASLDLDQRPFTNDEVRRLVIGLGPMSLRAAVLIVWQFLRIWIKGAKFVPKPAPPEEETSL